MQWNELGNVGSEGETRPWSSAAAHSAYLAAYYICLGEEPTNDWRSSAGNVETFSKKWEGEVSNLGLAVFCPPLYFVFPPALKNKVVGESSVEYLSLMNIYQSSKTIEHALNANERKLWKSI